MAIWIHDRSVKVWNLFKNYFISVICYPVFMEISWDVHQNFIRIYIFSLWTTFWRLFLFTIINQFNKLLLWLFSIPLFSLGYRLWFQLEIINNITWFSWLLCSMPPYHGMICVIFPFTLFLLVTGFFSLQLSLSCF